ncbi:hypothetical protein [Pseudomonas syringae]|uniref:hypothetical protein n=1 Tax=Pseudomonas syringae TaxID=317 RepID=UPI000CDA7DFD|nr:hypothetical protein [Pseudomonas syringae]POP66878.1 hypothetical protein CXB35_21265 [Pseudomonas syringae]
MSISNSELVLAANLDTAKEIFENALKSGLVTGQFDDLVWRYKGQRLHFTDIGKKSGTSPKASLPRRAKEIAQCYTARNILLQTSGELAVSRLNGLRHLSKRIGTATDNWHEMPHSLLNRTVSELKSSLKITSAYHRATAIHDLLAFLNNMHHRINGTDQRFLARLVKWKHGIENPIRSNLELSSTENERRREELYNDELHVAISKARYMVCSNEALEPSPGYHRIRLEALAFALSMGLRVGEICALPKRALDYDEDTGLSSIIVPTEKGAQPGATALADIWVPIVKEAFTYLTHACAAARKRAKQIETSGFEFVRSTLNNHRLTAPLSDSKTKQLESLKLQTNQVFFIQEITSCFDLSSKEFVRDGYYRSCQILLPQEVAARLALWFDARFERWDWAEHSTYYATSGYKIRLDEIITGSGASKSSINKSYWFIDDLRTLLCEMKNIGIFNPSTNITKKTMIELRRKWMHLREQMLSHRGGKSVAIDLEKFIEILKKDYRHYLSTHFKEEFSVKGNDADGGFLGNKIRIGVEPKLSEHLIVVWQNQFSGNSSAGILPRPLLRADLYNYLSNKGGKITCFERLRISDSSGATFSFSPHQIRRWLTTALLRSGPNETAIDLWMGRTPGQTRHYDHRTAKERAEWVRDRYINTTNLPDDVMGRRVKMWKDEGMKPEEIINLVAIKLQALHFTPWGTCSRELYVSPCTKGLMCLRGFGTSSGCESFHIDPADLEAKAAIILLRQKYCKMLSAITDSQADIESVLYVELNTSEPLDQHTAFIVDIIRGCDAALKNFINISQIGS